MSAKRKSLQLESMQAQKLASMKPKIKPNTAIWDDYMCSFWFVFLGGGGRGSRNLYLWRVKENPKKQNSV